MQCNQAGLMSNLGDYPVYSGKKAYGMNCG